MKLRFLLFTFLLSAGILNAQDTIKTLIISEIRLSHQEEDFVEITNIGNDAVQLDQFEFGLIRCWNNVPWIPENETRSFMLPSKMLGAGESFVLAPVAEFNPRMFKEGSDDYREKVTKDEIWTIADHVTHIAEAIKNETTDSVDSFWWTWETQNGRGTYFLKQHMENDSVVVDQAGGVFDGEGGLNNPDGYYDVAGVAGATANSILIRKFNVKEGNLEFVRGTGATDSEWIPVPIVGGAWRDVFWTLGNHGDYNLDATTLVSEVLDIDFENKEITVPWGTRSNDDIMHKITRKPGVAWKYDFSPVYEDSLYMSARNGDQLTIMVCGNDLDMETFDIIVEDPADNANIVIPKYHVDEDGAWRETILEGEISWPRVTRNESGIDTITGARNGIPYATRVDSLLKYLEKAPEAEWEIVWADGVERADLKDGDKLKLTAKDQSVKEYVISVRAYRPNHNALLSTITWPDIPEDLKDTYGWVGDTIPGFNPGSMSYRLFIPEDVNEVPLLMAKMQDQNATLKVERAASLIASADDRTIKFIVTAEDGVETKTYSVELVKLKTQVDLQPFTAEPFISQFTFWINWTGSNLWEFANPGNQPLDMSNYMIVGGPSNNPSEALLYASDEEGWMDRYRRYVPGYKWVGEEDWAVTPSMLEPDLNVSPIVLGGDVFVIGALNTNAGSIAIENTDIDFVSNPWNEETGATCSSNWTDQNFHLFKILTDSIKEGKKAATDINDFELIDTWGTGESAVPYGWFEMTGTCIRKPQFTVGKPGFKESFGTGWWDTSEWFYQDPSYFNSQGVYDNLAGTWDIGKHYMYEPTGHKSTVYSRFYIVSEGYVSNQTIEGVRTGTSAAVFLDNIAKADEGQTLTLLSAIDGTEIAMDVDVSTNDTLLVLSADEVNTTKYVLSVTEEGMGTDALLTSSVYTITADEEAGTGSVTGFDLGTTLRTVIENVSLPTNGSMQIIDKNGAYVSLQMVNTDTVYVDVIANTEIYLEVFAEDAVTMILYQLMPNGTSDDAFLVSYVYSVVEDELVIDLVPEGVNVSSFLGNIIASAGASMKLIDKNGLERVDGLVVDDDKLVVTSASGNTTKTYSIVRLVEETGGSAASLAYIESSTYDIDQISHLIEGVSENEAIEDFLADVTPAEGATVIIVDADGNEKTSGVIEQDDKVKVTSSNGTVITFYTFGDLVTSIQNLQDLEITLFPNPASSHIDVNGLVAGCKIQVYNSLGVSVWNQQVNSDHERIPMSNQPSGFYIIVVSKDNNTIGRFKALIK